jgi:hypothetical protein
MYPDPAGQRSASLEYHLIYLGILAYLGMNICSLIPQFFVPWYETDLGTLYISVGIYFPIQDLLKKNMKVLFIKNV